MNVCCRESGCDSDDLRAVFVLCSLGPPPAPSRGLHKHYDGDDVISDYSQELKDYGSTFEMDQRRLYRSGDSPSSHSCRNGRYTSPGAHDDVFLDRCDSKSQSNWDTGGRSGYKSSDDWMSSRGGQRSHSPSDSERSRGAGVSRSRTSQSISPVRRRYLKEHKVISPTVSSTRDYCRHDDRVSRRNSFESPDHDRYSSRTSDVNRSWTHVGSGDCSKTRTVANDIDGDSSAVSDRDRLLRTSDGSGAAHRSGTVPCDAGRRHSDASRSHVIRSVVNTTPSWRFDSDYKRSSHSMDHVSESSAVDSNHIGLALQKLRSETIEVGSDSTSPRSKSPRAVSDVDDAEVSGTQPDRPPSKGSDDMSHLEKEKSHLLNMLKELEDYSSGGSEIEGLDEESRAVLCRLRRQRDEAGDNGSDVSSADARRGVTADSSRQIPATLSRVQDCSVSKLGVEPVSGSSKTDANSAFRLSETSRQSSTNSDTKKRRVSLENHVGHMITSSLDAEDNIIDLIGTSPPAEIPAEFTRRQRASSDVTAIVSGDGGVKPRRSYRPRGSADSADSGTEDGHCISAMPHQPADPGRAVRPEDSSCSSSTAPNVHRTHSLEEVSSTPRRASTSGPSRKGSGGDHQPCIIPDSPVTTRGPDIRPPTEPRTVSLTVTAGGRTIMDLPLPRFGLDRHRLRHPSASAAMPGEHTTSLASTSARLETAASHIVSSNTVTVKTDVAPFSPGLLSPAMSPPAVRLDTSATTVVSTLVSSSISAPSAMMQDKTEKEQQLSVALPTGTESLDAVQKETPSVESADVKADASVAEVDKVVASDEVTVDTCDTEIKKTEPKVESEKPVVGSGKEVSAAVMPVSGSNEISVAISDSDVSDLLSPGSPPDTLSLEDRIRALDEKLSQMQKTTPRHLPVSDSSSSPFDYSRFIRRRKQPNTPTAATESPAASEPSDYVKSLLSRTSIFDQDSRRLEQLQSKFDTTVSTSGCNLTESGSLSLVSRMRCAGRLPPYDLSLQLPLSISSSYPSCTTSVYRSSDVAVQLSSPVGSYCSRSSNLVTLPSSSWGMSAVTVTTPGGAGWNSGWTGLSSVTTPSPAPQVTSSTPDSVAVRPSSHLPYGMPQTPGAVSSSSAPTDPRRAPRSSADVFPSSMTARRQDSSHSSDTSSDAWTLNSAVRREPELSTVPSKPKEMVSPPVSILKKTSTSSMPKDDVVCTNVKGSEGSQSSIDAPSTGMKRSADAAFGKEPTLSTPNKVVARTPKPVAQPPTTSEVESHSTGNKVSETDQQKTPASVAKRPEAVKKPVQLKPPAAKVDDKKMDHGTSATVTSGRKTSEDVSKSGCSVKPQTKLHSSTSSSLSTSSTLTVSKSQSHRDPKPAHTDSSRHTVGLKESFGADNNSADNHSSSHTSGGSSKPKTSHSISKEATTKDSIAEDQDKSVMSEEKDTVAREKSTSHGSSKHHQSEHRHSDKTSRDGKPDDASKASKVFLPPSTPKSAPKSAARDPAKSDRLDKNLHGKPKPEAYSSMKKESLEAGKKGSVGHPKPSWTNKSDGDHKSEKDESNRDQSSMSNMQTKPLKKPGRDSVPANKPSSSSKSSSTSSGKPRHADRSSSDRKNEGKKPEPSQLDKSKKPPSAAADKNKAVKKKSEKRPEEKREVIHTHTYRQTCTQTRIHMHS